MKLFRYLFGVVAALAAAIESFIKAQWAQYTAFGQFLLVLALAAICVDAAISYEYGVSMTTLHGLGFALVAIAFAILPDVASMEYSKGKRAAAFWVGLACVPLGVVGYQSHIGYGAGVRSGDIQQARVTNAKYDGGQMLVAKTEGRIGELKAEFASLNSEMDKLVATKVNGWSVETRPASPAALDGMIAAKTLERDNEAKRKYCGGKCEARTNELAHMQNLRALAVKIERNQTAYDAAQAELVALTKEAGTMAYESSTVVNQNGAFAKLWKVANGAAPADAIKADEVTAEFINIMTAGSGALAFMMLAPLLMFAAGRNRRPDFLGLWTGGHEAASPAHATSSVLSECSAPVRAVTVPATALAAVEARRQRIAAKVVGMRQSRIDGGLITAAA